MRAQEIIESLREDIQEELGHATQYANRIKELYGVVPGSMRFSAEQSYLQPPEHQTDIVHVIRGVIEAETGAIARVRGRGPSLSSGPPRDRSKIGARFRYRRAV